MSGRNLRADPVEWARKMAEAKERARLLRESRAATSAGPPSYQESPREDIGPARLPEEHTAPPAAPLPSGAPVPYRGMVKFGGPPSAEPAVTRGAPAPATAVQPRADPVQAAAAAAAKAQAEADAAFYSMLRSDEPPAPGSAARRPQWNSEYSEPAEPLPAASHSRGGAGRTASRQPATAAQQQQQQRARPQWNSDFAGPEEPELAPSATHGEPESKLQRLQRMRAEMGAASNDPRTAHQYAGIAPPSQQQQQRGVAGGRGAGAVPFEDQPLRAAGAYALPAAAAAAPLSVEDQPIRAAGSYKFDVPESSGDGRDPPGGRAAPSRRAPPPPAAAARAPAADYADEEYEPDFDETRPSALPVPSKPPKLALLKSKLRSAASSRALETGDAGGSPPHESGSYGDESAREAAPQRRQSRAHAGRPLSSAAQQASLPAPVPSGGGGLTRSPVRGGGGPDAPQFPPPRDSLGGGGRGAPVDEQPPEGSVALFECSGCGRKFNEAALSKHAVREEKEESASCFYLNLRFPPFKAQKVCKKVFQTKRAAFDSKAQAVPEEAKQIAAKAASPPPKAGAGRTAPVGAARPVKLAAAPADDAAGNKTKWEEKSNALRNAMKAARDYKAAIAAGKSGADLPPPPASAPDPSLVQCPTCGRSFNETAAERHIPKCASIINKPKVLMKGTGVQYRSAAGIAASKAAAAGPAAAAAAAPGARAARPVGVPTADEAAAFSSGGGLERYAQGGGAAPAQRKPALVRASSGRSVASGGGPPAHGSSFGSLDGEMAAAAGGGGYDKPVRVSSAGYRQQQQHPAGGSRSAAGGAAPLPQSRKSVAGSSSSGYGQASSSSGYGQPPPQRGSAASGYGQSQAAPQSFSGGGYSATPGASSTGKRPGSFSAGGGGGAAPTLGGQSLAGVGAHIMMGGGGSSAPGRSGWPQVGPAPTDEAHRYSAQPQSLGGGSSGSTPDGRGSRRSSLSSGAQASLGMAAARSTYADASPLAAASVSGYAGYGGVNQVQDYYGGYGGSAALAGRGSASSGYASAAVLPGGYVGTSAQRYGMPSPAAGSGAGGYPSALGSRGVY